MKERKLWRLAWLVCLVLMACFAAEASTTCTQHDFQWIEVQPSCVEPGYHGYQCSICGQTKEFESIPELGHQMGQWMVIDSPTCTKEGTDEAVCSRCGDTVTRKTEKLPHIYTTSTVDPTCTKDGYVLHKCTSCSAEIRTDPTPQFGHTFTVWVEEPTCKKDGYTLYTCDVCGYEQKADRVKATGHNYIPTVTAATCTADGYTRWECANCGDAYRTDPVEKTGHHYNNGIITKEPTWTTMGRKTFTCYGCGITYQETTPKLSNPFVDVYEGKYSYDSVIWAVGMEITNGTDDTHFSPDAVCTRGQVVTFLWRAAGQPNPVSAQCAFVDISQDAYYYNAVLWAVEQEITNGVDETHFGPDRPCTRGHVVTFLHRYKGLPSPKTACGFTDVPASAYYYNAVRWCAENSITEGTGGTLFSPDAPCTRGQIVTFLHRAKNK